MNQRPSTAFDLTTYAGRERARLAIDRDERRIDDLTESDLDLLEAYEFKDESTRQQAQNDKDDKFFSKLTALAGVAAVVAIVCHFFF